MRRSAWPADFKTFLGTALASVTRIALMQGTRLSFVQIVKITLGRVVSSTPNWSQDTKRLFGRRVSRWSLFSVALTTTPAL